MNLRTLRLAGASLLSMGAILCTGIVDTPDAALRDWLKGCGLTHTTSEALMVRHDPAAPEAYRSYGRGAVTFALAAQAFG